MSSRVSTMDTNYMKTPNRAQSDNVKGIMEGDDQNFLSNSHKRTKKTSTRYPNEEKQAPTEKMMFPQIKLNHQMGRKIPFGVKRIS